MRLIQPYLRRMLLKIFNPFYSTKDPGKGMGIGMYLVYSIVKRHGGEINIESKVGGKNHN
jgi:signal transduction histidine kinase